MNDELKNKPVKDKEEKSSIKPNIDPKYLGEDPDPINRFLEEEDVNPNASKKPKFSFMMGLGIFIIVLIVVIIVLSIIIMRL